MKKYARLIRLSGGILLLLRLIVSFNTVYPEPLTSNQIDSLSGSLSIIILSSWFLALALVLILVGFILSWTKRLP